MTALLTRVDELAVISIDRPHVLNAVNVATLETLAILLAEVGRSDARAVMITGTGSKAFCAGADIKELMANDLAAQRQMTIRGQAIISLLEGLQIPSVAVVNGYALGAGLEIALACTFRVAGRRAKFALPEIKLGLIPGYGGTQRLPRLIGEGRALELILTGRSIDADEAQQIGLVNRVFEDPLLPSAYAFVREITCYGRLATCFARSAVLRAADTPVNEGLKIEADLSTLAFQTADATEGMTAFLEKRPAQIKDR